MKPSPKDIDQFNDGMLDEYDFSDAELVSYRDRYRQGVSVTIFAPDKEAVEASFPNSKKFVLLDTDNANRFPDAASVNAALRSL